MWGRHGAAGLFLVAEDSLQGEPAVLMQHRAEWTNFGGTWGIPGGARDLHETVEEAALRETVEECGIDPDDVDVIASYITSGPFPPYKELPGGWTYSTVIARTRSGKELDTTANNESAELRWVALSKVQQLNLLGPFAEALPGIIGKLEAQR
ncbi:MAG: NUDIX hydrolase [Corynebacterium sp.]|nr:NUDIX hydrolase [Corynebacterium sp.]